MAGNLGKDFSLYNWHGGIPTAGNRSSPTLTGARLIRLGYGIYVRAASPRLSGKPMLYSTDGFMGAACQALDKLGVEWEPTKTEQAYNAGRSTQIPVNPVVRVRDASGGGSATARRRLLIER